MNKKTPNKKEKQQIKQTYNLGKKYYENLEEETKKDQP